MRSLHAPGRQALRKGATTRGLPLRMLRRPSSIKAIETDTDKEVATVQPGTKIKPLAPRRSPAWLSKMQGIKILGLKPSPELVAISMVYFVQGILGLSRLALSFFFKDTLNLEPAEVALITGLAGIPWMIKPLYGFISDSIPLWGYHRRSYLVLAGLTGFSSWVCLCFFVTSPVSAAAAMLAASLSTAASDVLVDSLVVERARDAPQATAGSLQSLCWGSAAVGGILSAYWSGSLVEHFGTRFVFGITALFPLIVSCSALLIDEQRISSKTGPAFPGPAPSSSPTGSSAVGPEADREGRLASMDTYKLHSQVSNGSVHHRSLMGGPASRSGGGVDSPVWDQERAPLLTGQAAESQGNSAASNGGDQTPVGRVAIWPQMVARGRMLWSAISRKDILLPTLFVFVWQATPSAESAMFYFQTNELGFQAEFLGRVRLVSSLASLAGVLLYNTTLKKVPLRTLLMWAMILGTTLGSTQLLLVSRANVALGLSDQLFVLGDAALLTALGQASFMPILVLAARLCPQGVEATLFATLMSVLNAGSFVGSGLGAGATKLLGVTSTDFTNLFTLVLLCNLAQLLPAPLLRLLPDSLDKDDDEDSSGSGSGSGTFDASIMPPGQAEEGAGPHAKGNGAVVDVELQATALPGEHAPHKSISGTEPLVLGIGDVVHASDGHNKNA